MCPAPKPHVCCLLNMNLYWHDDILRAEIHEQVGHVELWDIIMGDLLLRASPLS